MAAANTGDPSIDPTRVNKALSVDQNGNVAESPLSIRRADIDSRDLTHSCVLV